MTPRWLWLPASAGLLLVALPLLGVLTGIPWSRLGTVLTAPAARDAIGLSLRTALASTALVVVLGLPLALVLSTLRRGALLRVVVLAPLALPPVVSGLALLAAFGRGGLLGPVVGRTVAYTTLAVVLAQAFVSMPYLVLTLDGALRSRDPRAENAVRALGVGPTQLLRWVTLPGLAPALASGVLLALARAIGEFGATLTFAGSLQGQTRTLPLEIYLERETDPAGALGLSLVLVALAVAVVACLYRARGISGPPGDQLPGSTTPEEHQPSDSEAPRGYQPSGSAVGVDVVVAARGCTLRLSVAAGERVAVVGPNGAGKSTLLGVVAGIVPYEGQVSGVGRAALVDQHAHLVRHLTALDDVALGPRARGCSRPEARSRAAAALTLLGAGHLAGRRPDSLSGGQRQRVAIARGIAADPGVLLLDEPFAALDVESAAALRADLAAATEGVTTLLVTHDAADIRSLATRVVVVEGGRVTADGDIDAVCRASRFARALLG